MLARVGAAAYQRWADMLTDFRLTPNQYKVLMALAETEPVGQQRLTDLVGIDPRNAGPIIESLVEMATVKRDVDSSDRRRRVLSLTTKGRTLATRLISVSDEVEHEYLELFSPHAMTD